MSRCSGVAAMKQPNRSVKPGIMYRAPRWPFLKSRASALDKLQAAMVARAGKLDFLPDETAECYKRRRSRAAATLCRKHGTWSGAWEQSLCRWRAHLGRHPESWPSRALRFQDADWLRQRRVTLATPGVSCLTGRTDTRAAIGPVSRRWEESMEELARDRR